MKKLIANATCFAFIGLGFLSCQKETVQPSESSTQQKSSVHDKDANFVNPYEFVGEVHNLALKKGREVLAGMQQSGSSQSGSSQSGSGPVGSTLTVDQIKEVFKEISELVKEEFNFRGYGSSITPELSPKLLSGIQNQSSNELWEEMLADMDKTQKQVMVKFSQDVENYLDHGNLDLAILNMKNLENQVNNNPKIAGDDKVLMLSMLALGRHSFMYWAERDLEEIGPAYIGNGKWKADIGAFRDDWKQHANNPTWGFRERWDSATDAGSAASSMYD